jgi:non-ribosomal peptide synthetase-like protein
MIPVDGPVRENVGLLGSPCFEIPRAVDRDREFNTALDDEARQQRIQKKNAHNIVTVVLFLLGNWLFTSVALLLGYAAVFYYPQLNILSVLGAAALLSFVTVLYFAFLERASLGFKPLQPKVVSIYDQYFWFHERHWKFCESPLQTLYKGTPFKNVISRLLGVKIGRKVFDGGCQFLEKTLIEIGDYTNLNEATTLQGHSLEEGVFKSDHIRIGKGCSVGCHAFVHYGTTMGDNVMLDPDSFLMKGEILDPDTTWRGNPARAVRGTVVEVAVTRPERSQPRRAAAAL